MAKKISDKNSSFAEKLFIGIPDTHSIEIFALHDIICMEGNGRTTNFFIRNSRNLSGAAVIRRTSPHNLGHYEKILHNGFMRVHKSYIINTTHICFIRRNNVIQFFDDIAVVIKISPAVKKRLLHHILI